MEWRLPLVIGPCGEVTSRRAGVEVDASNPPAGEIGVCLHFGCPPGAAARHDA